MSSLTECSSLRRLVRLSLAFTLTATTGCVGLLFPTPQAPVQHLTAANPIDGTPAELGFVSEKDDACDVPVPKDAARLRVDGERLCVDQRRSVTREVGTGAPEEKTWVTRVKTDSGITDRITMTAAATPVAKCDKGNYHFRVWTYNLSECVPNGGVLTKATASASLRNVEAVNGEGDEFAVFTFASPSAAKSESASSK